MSERSFTAVDLVGLPNLDAVSLVALSQALDAAAPVKDDHKKAFRSTLPELVQDALADAAEARAALQAEIDKEPPASPTVRVADRREDTAVLAFIELLGAWARLAGEIPEGDTAAQAFERLFGTGSTAFINFPVKKEWAIVDGKLKVIDGEQLDGALEKLGAGPMLEHLRGVHVAYGEAIGVTKPKAAKESTQLRAKKDELAEATRTYVVRVVGLRDKKKPQTNALVDRLLKPLVEWEPAEVAGKAAQAPAKTPAEPPKP
jgi:hypothetical protein